jgi:hypothetical protein
MANIIGQRILLILFSLASRPGLNTSLSRRKATPAPSPLNQWRAVTDVPAKLRHPVQ